LIQAGISLTTLLDPQGAVSEIAVLARKTLEARFVFITLLDQQGNFSRIAHAGEAPKLLSSLNVNPSQEPIIQAALNAVKPFRVRDVRKYASSKSLEIDHGGMRSVLAIPIRLHRLSIGTILAFGKQDGIFFSEKDESLADLLSSQAAASIESSWLYQELRSTLNTTSLLYQLSLDVTQTEDLERAAALIAQAAHKSTNASETGILLLSKEGEVQVEVGYDVKGFHSRRRHPMANIDQAHWFVILCKLPHGSSEHFGSICPKAMARILPTFRLWPARRPFHWKDQCCLLSRDVRLKRSKRLINNCRRHTIIRSMLSCPPWMLVTARPRVTVCV
jgi:GAF domain-containing protein